MKPAPFDYLRSASVAEAVAALAEFGDGGKVLAGGQSLLPMMNFRLARPDALVDIGGLGELRGVRADGDFLHRQTISDTELTGAKGIGEGGTIGAPAAVLSAIADALDHLGVEVFHMPQSPHRLHASIAAARAQATAPERAAGSGGHKGEK